MFTHYSFLKNKFTRVFNTVLKEKPFLKESQEFLTHHYIYLVTSQYISDKFGLVKAGPMNYEKKLRRLFQIDNFSDKQLLNDIAIIQLRFIVSVISLIQNPDEIENLKSSYLGVNKELEIAKNKIKKNRRIEKQMKKRKG